MMVFKATFSFTEKCNKATHLHLPTWHVLEGEHIQEPSETIPLFLSVSSPPVFPSHLCNESGLGSSDVFLQKHPHPSHTACSFLCVVSSKADVVQLLSCVQLFVTPWTTAHQAPHPPLSPRVCSDSCPLSQWYHPTTSSSSTPFSYPQTFLTSESFPVSSLFA